MNVPSLTASQLRAADRAVSVPFALRLDDGRTLVLHTALRILPGKRISGIAELDGATVFAKLFIASGNAERHWQREVQGKSVMATRHLPTPAVLASGSLAEGGHYLLTEYLSEARPLRDTDDPGHLALAFTAFGRLHAAGLAHDDAHLNNFLLHRGSLQLVDGDAVRELRSEQDALDNLALLLVQLPPAAEMARRESLLAAYRTGNPTLAVDLSRLQQAVSAARQLRLNNYLDKCVRDCTRFRVEKRPQRFVAVVRDEADFLAPIMEDPDRWLEQGIPLKRGNTATLALVEHGGRKLVIKRYNIKNATHALSRCWRPTRAWHSWIEGHRLTALGFVTPRPLALIEQRFGPLRGKAWLIVEHCAGQNLVENPPSAATINAVRDLFVQLTGARISHGDMKATNLLWHEGRICLIDLDAMQQHGSEAGYRRAWQKDRSRFLRNWPADSALVQALTAVLPPD
jgi:tRNA A-37 threonylcarbamoyl transferase component Bud32